jgi:hypothetical protein
MDYFFGTLVRLMDPPLSIINIKKNIICHCKLNNIDKFKHLQRVKLDYFGRYQFHSMNTIF